MSTPKYFNARLWGQILNLEQLHFLRELTSKTQGVEEGATADQTAEEIQTAYDSVVDIVSQADAEAGVSTDAYRWTPERVAQAIASLGAASSVGVAIVDFGAFPGASDTSVAVTGQSGIVAGSAVVAQILAKATADHSVDEHVVEELVVMAGNISAGTGFTIYARTRNAPLYGQWSVAWSWA